MAHNAPGRTPNRRTARTLIASLLVAAAITAAIGHQWSASSSAPSTDATEPLEQRPPASHHSRRVALDETGRVRGGVTVFDDETPAVTKLDPALLGALRHAATDAAAHGVELLVNSGWRSVAYQEQLLRDAISKYGSEEEASRWVATPKTSAHVSGHAVDIGPSAAAAWLSKHGSGYGLCQIYRNEAWHYELRPAAADRGCPPMYADPTHDPRMHR
jgi:zinc D-Ala-D-Ala carboxypeptidase